MAQQNTGKCVHACSVSRWEGESNEDVWERFCVSATTKGVDCGVAEI